jgi:hypothetical protein
MIRLGKVAYAGYKINAMQDIARAAFRKKYLLEGLGDRGEIT